MVHQAGDAGFIAWANGVDTSVAAAETSAHASATYVPFAGKISDLASPVIVAHRSAGLLAPENTLEGARYASGLPSVNMVDAADFRATRDGAIVCSHDSTADQYTNLSGNISDFTLAALRKNAIVDAGNWLGGSWPTVFMPTAREIMHEFGGLVPISVEAKDATAATKVAAMISAGRYGASVLANGSSVALVSEAVAAGAVGAVFYTSAQVGTTTAAAIAAAATGNGMSDVILQHGSDMTKVAALIALGIKVWIYDVFRQYEYATYSGTNIRGFFLDDPLYTPGVVANYRQTSVSWTKAGTWGPGHLNVGNNLDVTVRGTFVGSAGAYRWQPLLNTFNLLGELCPVANAATSYTITVPITYDTVGTDVTRWAGIYFGQADDYAYIDGQADARRNGYSLIMRSNGDAQLFRITGGTATQLGSTSAMPDFTSGTTVTLTVAVTPTSITVTRSDAGPSISSSDTTWRGGYMFAGESSNGTNNRVSFGAVAIS